MSKLADDQLEALFCTHWQKTRDLVATLRLVIEAAAMGAPRAIARAGSEQRQRCRPAHQRNLLARAAAVGRAKPILERFARWRGVDARAFVARRGPQSASRTRYEAMWVLRVVDEDLSFPEIGLAVGGRCHSDAIAGVRKTEERIAADPALRARLQAFVLKERRRSA